MSSASGVKHFVFTVCLDLQTAQHPLIAQIGLLLYKICLLVVSILLGTILLDRRVHQASVTLESES